MRIADTAGGEAGVTLPEVLIGILLTLIIGGSAMAFLTTAVRSEPTSRERAADIERARTFTERIGRELRQGESVATASASTLTIVTYVHDTSCGGTGGASSPAILCRVTYACGTSCTRAVHNADGSGPGVPQTLVTGLSGQPVFTYASAYAAAPCPGSATGSNPTYICMRLVFPAEGGEDSVTLNDGVALRNWFQPS